MTRTIATVWRNDVEYLAEPFTLHDKPLPWQAAGLQETASGYGRRLRSTRVLRLADGRERRIYVTIFSNSGTSWIRANGRSFVVID